MGCRTLTDITLGEASREGGPGRVLAELGLEQSAFDMVIALSPASQRRALELTRLFHLDVEYWPVLDPTGLGEGREQKLEAYRQTRDQIRERLIAKFGPPQKAD